VLREFRADLHVHTCLSPCADWEMSPCRIVRRSREAGLSLIAVCDHNSAENAGAVAREGRRRGLPVLPGLEICSREEVHVLAIFDRLPSALAMQEMVYARLDGENRPELFGHQIVATDNDEVLAENTRLLIGATGLALAEIVRTTRALGGLSLAAHVDRPANSIIGQLGFVPEDLEIDGVEVSHRTNPAQPGACLQGTRRLPWVRSSDAHVLSDIGRASTVFRVAAPTIAEMRLALKGAGGRGVRA
jgi:predicted metal-dependent phosphoesterase TrpH